MEQIYPLLNKVRDEASRIGDRINAIVTRNEFAALENKRQKHEDSTQMAENSLCACLSAVENLLY